MFLIRRTFTLFYETQFSIFSWLSPKVTNKLALWLSYAIKYEASPRCEAFY